MLTELQIKEGRRVIATFVGANSYGIKETGANPLRGFFKPKDFDAAESFGYKLLLSYHQDWALFMPAYNTFRLAKDIPGELVTTHGDYIVQIVQAVANYDIEKAFISLTAGISWYNSIKK